MNVVAKLWCRAFGHSWSRPKGSELKRCKRCEKVAPIKRRAVKTVTGKVE